MTPAQLISELPKSHGWSLSRDQREGLLLMSRITGWLVPVRLAEGQTPREIAQAVCNAAWVSLSQGCAQRDSSTGRDHNRLKALIELHDSELWLGVMVKDRASSTRHERIVDLLRRLALVNPLRFGSEYDVLVGLDLGDSNSPWYDYVCFGDTSKVADALCSATEPLAVSTESPSTLLYQKLMAEMHRVIFGSFALPRGLLTSDRVVLLDERPIGLGFSVEGFAVHRPDQTVKPSKVNIIKAYGPIPQATQPRRMIMLTNAGPAPQTETEHQRMARFFFTSEHDKVEKPRDIESLMHEQIGADPRVKSVGPISKAVAAMVPFRTAHGTEFPMYQLTRSGMRSYEAYGVRLEVRPHDVRLVDENGIVHEALTVPEAARSSLSIPHSPDRPSRDYRAVAVLATLELYAPRFEDDQATLRHIAAP